MRPTSTCFAPWRRPAELILNGKFLSGKLGCGSDYAQQLTARRRRCERAGAISRHWAIQQYPVRSSAANIVVALQQ